MYGAKRLGVIKENCLLMKKPTQNGNATPVIVTAGKPPAKTSIYPLGKKHYESTDRLKNYFYRIEIEIKNCKINNLEIYPEFP
ncbi:MAG: hypothetical protein KatS3mg035_2046 [Bacteroidia bacterium]|nr:MAG: hypothetical protein KatS3mg035_2046 [Bacteroidia bacterium]